MARKSKSQQPNVGAWLGGNRGYLRSGSNTDTSAKIDAGGGQMEQVRAELGLGAYVAGVGATAAIGAGIAAARSGAVGRAVNKIGDKTVLLAHGGAADLVGGKINPTFARELQQQLDSTTMRNLAWAIDPKNAARITNAKQVKKIQGFIKRAETSGGFFSASATGEMPAAYAVPRKNAARGANPAGTKSGGAVHVVKVPKKSVIRGGGETGEYLVAATPKPIQSFPYRSTGNPGKDIEDLAKQVDAFIKSTKGRKFPKKR